MDRIRIERSSVPSLQGMESLDSDFHGVLPSTFTVIYGLAAYLIYREYGSSQGHRAEDGTPLLNHEEMQRRQLLRLWQEHTPGAHTTSATNNTYRLDGFIPV